MFPGSCWWEWPVELRDRKKEALDKIWLTMARETDRYVALQFLFDRQWGVGRCTPISENNG